MGAQTEPIAGNALEIEGIYVKQVHQGMGIGKVLMNQALDVARKEEKSISHPFYLGSELQTDLLFKRTAVF